jgi:hypothetical protein
MPIPGRVGSFPMPTCRLFLSGLSTMHGPIPLKGRASASMMMHQRSLVSLRHHFTCLGTATRLAHPRPCKQHAANSFPTIRLSAFLHMLHSLHLWHSALSQTAAHFVAGVPGRVFSSARSCNYHFLNRNPKCTPQIAFSRLQNLKSTPFTPSCTHPEHLCSMVGLGEPIERMALHASHGLDMQSHMSLRGLHA